jgi:SAM-dependent methyltransferase
VAETAPTGGYPKWDYELYPRTLARDDFWGQVRRTINGRRISEREVVELVRHLRRVLELRTDDVLLDLGCGNGALSSRLFDQCDAYVGVDRSEYLIEVARENFARLPRYQFLHGDVVRFAAEVAAPERYSKAVCYAVIQFLPPDQVEELVRLLRARFTNLSLLLLGNVPDRGKADVFFHERDPGDELDRYESQIGRWWSPTEVTELANRCGWVASFVQMPERVFNTEYRFDAILRPAEAR